MTTIQFQNNYLNESEIDNIILYLNKLIDDYKKVYNTVKIGITDKQPEIVVNNFQKKNIKWEKMIILYKIETLYILNIIEFWLINEHWNNFHDIQIKDEFELTFKKEKYLYVLSV